jgi:hypothetical protein
MKWRRSALPLPRYVQRKPLKSGCGHFFNVPRQMRSQSTAALSTDPNVLSARIRTCNPPENVVNEQNRTKAGCHAASSFDL